MEKPILIFNDYYVFNNDKKLTVKALFDYEGLEKFCYYSIYLIPLSFIWYLPLDFIKMPVLATILKLCLMVVVFFIAKPYIKRSLSKTILTLNKENKTLITNLDNDSFKISDIKKIDITEEEYTRTVAYRIKFHLSDGVKSSLFTFTNYNAVKEIIDIIRNAALQGKTQ